MSTYGVAAHTTGADDPLATALRLLDEDGTQEALREVARTLAEAGRDADAERALRIRDRLERHRRREAELGALQETARDLIRLRDVDHALRAIVRRARQLLAADVGYLSIYDPEHADFYVRATEGAVSADFRRIRVPQDVGICGAVARTRLPQFSPDYEHDHRFRHADGVDTGVLAEDIVALLGVPLLVDGEVIGVLFVASRTARSYSPQQIALLDSLGAHAAVGIENARLFQEGSAALQRAEASNAALRARTAEIQAAAEVHERLTALLTAGGGLDDVASVAADALDGHVEVLDRGLRPIAGSGAP
ncbi:GAF domain-containing protein, partial [Patulibacter sp. S7RM1-6]